VDRCGRRDLLVHARRVQRYDDLMTSPATMRLVGLLVIVGVVAGCGGDRDPPFDEDLWQVVGASQTPDPVAVRQLLLRQRLGDPAWKGGRYAFAKRFYVEKGSSKIMGAAEPPEEITVRSRPFVCFLCGGNALFAVPSRQALQRCVVVVSTDDELLIGHVQHGLTVRIPVTR